MELHRPHPVNLPPKSPAAAPLAPPMRRTPMAATPWRGLSLLSWLFRREPGPADVDGPARGAGRRRRLVLLVLSLAPAVYATYLLSGLLPREASSSAEKALLAVFAVLSCWLAAGFWTAMMGFVVLLRGGDRHLVSRSAAGTGPLPDEGRTAVVMPICNEDVQRVFAGLRATIESVGRAGALAHFDFFILSDSSEPDACVGELDACNALRETLGSDVRLFYRRRERRVKRKSGNLDDFCRRWGALYRYMVVLDADSVMSGECLSTLVRLMEARPDAGIIQTAPRAVGRDTLHARIQQFANQVYGPLFTAGLHYWQLGESHYWGHNAIIRLDPFMKHCVLAPLPGRGAPRRRDPVARLRRGRADAAGRLRRLDRVRPAGQLRGDAVEPDRGGRPRPPVVPRQPDERAADVRARHAPGAPHRVPDRRARLRVGSLVGRLSRCCRRGCW